METTITNRLLDRLPAGDRARLMTRLQPVSLALGTVIYESGVPMRHLYFPTSAVVALLFVTESGASTALAVTGREGVVGISLFMGGESTPSRGVVQVAGEAWRLPAAELMREFDEGGPLRRALLRYTQALITQMSQTAVCNRHHPIDQRLCRWLLMHLDRVGGPEVRMTQQAIADMLGVRREGVTLAASRLQDEGVIRCSRGVLEVLDRTGVERRACECYAVVQREDHRLLGEAAMPR